MTTTELSQAIKAGAVSANDYGLDKDGVIEVGGIEPDGTRKILVEPRDLTRMEARAA